MTLTISASATKLCRFLRKPRRANSPYMAIGDVTGAVGPFERGDERRVLGFAGQDRDDRGGVDDDHGSPLSSS